MLLLLSMIYKRIMINDLESEKTQNKWKDLSLKSKLG